MIMFQIYTVSCTLAIFFFSVFIRTCFAVIVTVDDIGDVVEGSETRITCKIVRSSSSSVANPTVTWNNVTNGVSDVIARYQVGLGSVERSYRDRFSVEGDTTLVIANILRSDSGTYQCSVTLVDDPPSPASDDIILTVICLYKPILISFATPVTEGDTAEMSCSSDANPLPTYTFLRGGEVQQSAGSSTLRFQSVSRENSGSYECRASNSAGTETSDSRTLDVQYAPEITPLSNIEVSRGESVSIRFLVFANPTANYAWTTTPETTDTDNDPETYTFIVSDGKCDETYTVTLEATNDVGTTQKSVEVTVVALAPTSTSVSCTCPTESTLTFTDEQNATLQQKGSSADTGLIVGMTFVGFFIGIFLSSSVFMVQKEMKKSKEQEIEATTRNVKQSEAYMEYGESTTENHTYQDIQKKR